MKRKKWKRYKLECYSRSTWNDHVINKIQKRTILIVQSYDIKIVFGFVRGSAEQSKRQQIKIER